MMKQRLLNILLLITGAAGFSHAQYIRDIPEIKKPELYPTMYQNLKSEYIVKDTKKFGLKGNVKSITETITSGKGTKLRPQTNRYEFAENNRLTYYQEGDTMETWVNSRGKSWQYLFDSEQNKLTGIIYYDGRTQNSYRSAKKLDDDGYVVEEIYECYECGYDRERDKHVFDYTLNYRWNKSRDSVYLDFVYKMPPTHYQRHTSSRVAFDSNKQIHQFIPYLMFGSQDIKYDKKGNITKWMLIDNTIKNSFNIDQLYEYKYNDNNELAEVAYSTFMHTSNEKKQSFSLFCRDEIQTLEYDTNGNWILKKVTRHDAYGEKEFTYRREITYY